MIRKTIISALTVAAVAAGVWAQPAGSPVAQHGTLSVKGNAIVDKNGEPFQLRGMSLFWMQWSEGSQFYTSGTVNTLADDWKANVVRAAVSPTNTGSPPNDWKTVVDAAIAKGIYVVVDWHSHKKSEKGNAQTFFKTVSNSYKNTANVIYEIFNEPCPTSDGSRGCDGDAWSDLKTYATDVVKTIRDNGDDNIIIIGTPDYSKRVDQASQNPVSGKNLAYAVHYYTATDPPGQHNADLRGWCAAALDRGFALLVTEFGVSEADGNGKLNTANADVWFDFLDSYQVGWMNWSITAKGESSAALSSGGGSGSGWSYTPSGTYIRNKLRMYASTTYPLTVTTSGEGSVTKFPNRTNYTHGYPVSVKAVPSSGWKFAGWEGGGITAPRNVADSTFISMTESRSATAIFEPSNNAIVNGTFTTSASGWTGNGTTVATDNYQLKVTPTSGATDPRVQRTAIPLTSNTKYQLSFKARGQSARPIDVSIGPTSLTGTPFMAAQTFQLSTSMQEFKAEFNYCGAADITNAVMRIMTGTNTAAFFIDDVFLVPTGTVPQGACQPSSTLLPIVSRTPSWSLSRTSGTLTLRGPAEHGAKVQLFDTRGKMVRNLAAKDGMTLGKNIPAGNYLVVVRNAAGREVLRDRVSMVR